MCVCVCGEERGSVTFISNKTDKSVGNSYSSGTDAILNDYGLKSSHEGLTLDLGGAGVT